MVITSFHKNTKIATYVPLAKCRWWKKFAKSLKTSKFWIPTVWGLNISNMKIANFKTWRSDFEGMQPTFKQVPPKVSPFSTQTVLNPNWAALLSFIKIFRKIFIIWVYELKNHLRIFVIFENSDFHFFSK